MMMENMGKLWWEVFFGGVYVRKIFRNYNNMKRRIEGKMLVASKSSKCFFVVIVHL